MTLFSWSTFPQMGPPMGCRKPSLWAFWLGWLAAKRLHLQNARSEKRRSERLVAMPARDLPTCPIGGPICGKVGVSVARRMDPIET